MQAKEAKFSTPAEVRELNVTEDQIYDAAAKLMQASLKRKETCGYTTTFVYAQWKYHTLWPNVEKRLKHDLKESGWKNPGVFFNSGGVFRWDIDRQKCIIL